MSPPDKENPKKAEIHSSKFIPLNFRGMKSNTPTS